MGKLIIKARMITHKREVYEHSPVRSICAGDFVEDQETKRVYHVVGNGNCVPRLGAFWDSWEQFVHQHKWVQEELAYIEKDKQDEDAWRKEVAELREYENTITSLLGR